MLTKENVLELSKNEGLICCCFLCAFTTNDNRTWPNCLKSIKKQTWSPHRYYLQQSQDSYSGPLGSRTWSLSYLSCCRWSKPYLNRPMLLFVSTRALFPIVKLEDVMVAAHPSRNYFEKSPLEQLDAKSTSTFRDQWELNVHRHLLLSRICRFFHPGPLQWRLAWLKWWFWGGGG